MDKYTYIYTYINTTEPSSYVFFITFEHLENVLCEQSENVFLERRGDVLCERRQDQISYPRAAVPNE